MKIILNMCFLEYFYHDMHIVIEKYVHTSPSVLQFRNNIRNQWQVFTRSRIDLHITGIGDYTAYEFYNIYCSAYIYYVFYILFLYSAIFIFYISELVTEKIKTHLQMW